MAKLNLLRDRPLLEANASPPFKEVGVFSRKCWGPRSNSGTRALVVRADQLFNIIVDPPRYTYYTPQLAFEAVPLLACILLPSLQFDIQMMIASLTGKDHQVTKAHVSLLHTVYCREVGQFLSQRGDTEVRPRDAHFSHPLPTDY